jgi:hypothetical protein
MLDKEIKDRLNAAIDRVTMAMGPERERMARYVIGLLVPEVKKLIQEALREERRRVHF